MFRSYRYLRFPTAPPGVIAVRELHRAFRHNIQSCTRCGFGAPPGRGRFETAPYVRRHDKRCGTSVTGLKQRRLQSAWPIIVILCQRIDPSLQQKGQPHVRTHPPDRRPSPSLLDQWLHHRANRSPARGPPKYPSPNRNPLRHRRQSRQRHPPQSPGPISNPPRPRC